MNEKLACCFSGHRKLPKNKMEDIKKRLIIEIDNLIEQNVTEFISGGELGFDQVVARLIITKKEMGQDIRLVFALPCNDQEKFWDAEQKKLYYSLLEKADEIVYVSKEYTKDCMKKRNQYMVERSSYCICAMLYSRSGTGQTVRYAEKQNLYIVNVSE